MDLQAARAGREATRKAQVSQVYLCPKRLLDIAKRGVEMAIEQDEAAAAKWLDQYQAMSLRRAAVALSPGRWPGSVAVTH